MKLLMLAGFVGLIGLAPMYAYTEYVQPQLDSLEAMYRSFDETAADIADGKDITQTKTYQHAEVLSSSKTNVAE